MTSMPLMDIQVYRPGPYLALGILVIPVVVAVIGAATILDGHGRIPVWLPFLLLIWLPFLLVVWQGMLSVRTNSSGIAAGRPWKAWQEVPWPLIERVEESGAFLRVHGSNGCTLTFMPALLRDGSRLKRQLLLRLPVHVLSGSLAQEAQKLLAPGIYAMAEGGLSGTLHARPQPRWRLLLGGIALALLALGIVACLSLPLALGIATLVICVILSGVALLAAVWLMQHLLVNENGISVVSSLSKRSRGLQWPEVELVEHSTGQAVLRLRGSHRMLCAGPALLAPAERDLMRAFLHEYCVNRGVPIVRRPWLV